MKFNELNLEEWIVAALEKEGLVETTEIQAAVINKVLENKNIIARSQTGSGKTFAFGLPLLQDIDSEVKGIERLIVCPTRELAMQVADELRKISDCKPIGLAVAYGGSDITRQIVKIKKSKIVVGTPGRIIDHINRRTLKLCGLKTIVIDEADEMLDMGFKPDVEKIFSFCPENVQKLMFSATFSKEVKALAQTYMKNSEYVEAGGLQPIEIEQSYIYTDKNGKNFILDTLMEENKNKSIIVFCNTKKMVETLYMHLRKSYECAMLHGDMRQIDRKNMLNLIKQKSANVLIATDVAARGIDIKGLDIVINYDLPQMDEYYIHRVGRTGRAGQKGISYTILNTKEQLRRIEVISSSYNIDIEERVVKQKRIDVEKIKEKLFEKVKVQKDSKKTKNRFDKNKKPPKSQKNKIGIKSKNNKRVKHEKSFSNRWK